MGTQLYGRSVNNIALPDVVEKCKKALVKGQLAVALLYTPSWCRFGLLNEQGLITDHKGNKLELETVFEARVFNEVAELRWLNETGGKGRAVILSEDEAEISNLLPNILQPISALDICSQNYLLWGQGTGNWPGVGWSRLSEARIGKLDVPLANVPQNGRVQLSAIEYLAQTEGDENGNVSVVEERLIRLKEER